MTDSIFLQRRLDSRRVGGGGGGGVGLELNVDLVVVALLKEADVLGADESLPGLVHAEVVGGGLHRHRGGDVLLLPTLPPFPPFPSHPS